MIASVLRPLRRPAGAAAMTAALLCFAALTAGARPASAASEAEREARRAFESAEAHFRAGEFADALTDYQAGYQASPLPGFLVNIAQCQRRLGALKKARATYQKFVLVAPDSPLVPQVKGLIKELDRLLADLGEDKSAVPTAPPPAADREQTAGAAETGAPGGDLLAAPATPPSSPALLVAAPVPADRPASRRRWWIWGGIGTAVACGVVTALLLTAGADTVHDGSLGTLRR